MTARRLSSRSSSCVAVGCMGAASAASSGSGCVRVAVGAEFRALLVWIVAVVGVAAVAGVRGQAQAQALSVAFSVKPAAYSTDASPAFAFAVARDAGGVDPCASSRCSFQCKLDQGLFQDCSGRTFSASNLTDGVHTLAVAASASAGAAAAAPSIYAWAVDTAPPTATVATGALFTSAINITVTVTFSEDCSSGRTFQCADVTSCDLVVRGPALVYPSTLAALAPGLAYSLQVGLSTQVPTGKVTLTTARAICADAAGNLYQRSGASTAVVRFSRVTPSLNLWTPIPNSQVRVGDQPRTVQATNASADIPIYLDFSEPVVGTSADLQRLLVASAGALSPRDRKSRGNRRFAFSLSVNETRVAAVTVSLPANTTFSRYGIPVAETATVAFLKDVDRPEVALSTNSRAHTRDRLLPVVVQFSEPVFSFNSSGVALTGGLLQSFREVSKTTYAAVVWVAEGSSAVAVSVAENRTQDVAGNPNVASAPLRFKYYSSTPAISVALYSFITAGLLGTALFSGALAISAANIAAVGAVVGASTSCVGADASRNLLGMAGHMQVLALTSFLSASLPVEYAETANGLQWLIPHATAPWQKNPVANFTASFAASNLPSNLTVLNVRRSLISGGELHRQALFTACRMMHHWPAQYGDLNCSLYSETLWPGDFPSQNRRAGAASEEARLGRRRLGANGTEFGPAMVDEEYQAYFLSATPSALKDELLARRYTGWSDFWCNVFWVAVVGGSLILLHVLLLLFLRWRLKAPLHSALSFPRFELFLLVLSLPAIGQASAFLLRGGTKAGVAVGVALLLIPALLLLATSLLLVFGIFLGKRVQYRELRSHLEHGEKPAPPPTRAPLALLAGAGYPGEWARTEAASAAFIPRSGILFEDRKGPPTLVTAIHDTNPTKKKRSSGLRPAAPPASASGEHHDDERSVSWAYRALGCAQSAYVLVDMARRISLGAIFGAFRATDKSWTQVSLVVAVTSAQLVVLVATKPFRRRFVQAVETVSLLCELGIFVAAMAILSRAQPANAHWGIGVLMLALFVLSFVAQIANEWFALIRQLLWFSTDTAPSEIAPGESLRAFAVGLLLPFLPRSRWPQARTASKPSPAARSPEHPGHRPSSSSPAASSPRRREEPPGPAATTSKSAKHWPGADLQEWARQTSLERTRQGPDPVANAMVSEIAPADARPDAPIAAAARKARR